MKLTAIIFIFFGSNTLFAVSPENLKAAPSKAYIFFEMIQFMEMHVSAGMGFTSKILYTDMKITKLTPIGRIAETERDSSWIFNGNRLRFVYHTKFNYRAGDWTVLDNVTTTGTREMTPVDANGNIIGETTKENELYVFSVKRTALDKVEANLSFERSNSITGELVGFYKHEKPFVLTIKDYRIASVGIDGKIEWLTGTPADSWSMTMQATPQQVDLKGACRRIEGSFPNLNITYRNFVSGAVENFSAPVLINSTGLTLQFPQGDALYPYTKCTPY